MSEQFVKNKYKCDQCYGEIVTIDREEGYTPNMMPCESDYMCNGIMHSFFYSPASVGDAEPTHEWYRPNRAERRSGNKGQRNYFAMGGLKLRRLTEMELPYRGHTEDETAKPED